MVNSGVRLLAWHRLRIELPYPGLEVWFTDYISDSGYIIIHFNPMKTLSDATLEDRISPKCNVGIKIWLATQTHQLHGKNGTFKNPNT